jgi:PKD repeat protein
MRGFILLLAFCFNTWQITYSQIKAGSDHQSDSVLSVPAVEFAMTGLDSLWVSRLPGIDAGSILKNTLDLPSSLNNSALPYFRPIFSQGPYASCGQASGVSYNFCYEINRARNLPADVPENQYPTHYHWNFTNGGYGWFGSSYFHSFEILRTNGSPTVADYGGMDYGGGSRWLSGYEAYYSGMHNRIEGVYKIDVSTPEGLETLKHWLHNHLDGSETGGVASFYANSPWNLQYLPQNTPESGKPVITTWAGMPTHAMTVVGYNDSISWDYNGDGQYTNHLDINGDGIVDMRDWETGGLLFANSYGEHWGDQGFSYMMYKTLAENIFEGGIWDNAMHVLKVNKDYAPLLTAKITLKHTSRGMIKVQVGVANDPSLQYPQHTMDYPIFNFQGGNVFMQGGTDEEHKAIEFGLDITPLLDDVDPEQTAKFFLQVVENDPGNQHAGEIVAFSIIDYTGNTIVETAYLDSNVMLINNGITTLGISASVNYNRVQIQTEELPAFTPTEPLQVQLEAGGGLQPYKWTLNHEYTEHFTEFTEINKTLFKDNSFPGWNEWKTIDLDFDFPFYDNVYEQITAYANGFIMFSQGAHPYPYWLESRVLFQSFECIAPFMARNLVIKPNSDDEIWFETAADNIRINWRITYQYGDYQEPLVFSAVLFDDGRIEFHYEAFSFNNHCIWLAGVSKGDKINYNISEGSGAQIIYDNLATGFKPVKQPGNLHLSEAGFLTCDLETAEIIHDIPIEVKDGRYITDRRTFQLTDAIVFDFAPVKAGLIASSTPDIEVSLHNISPTAVNDLNVCFDSPDDDHINWLNPCFNAGNLAPGETKSFSLGEAFAISSLAPENLLLEITGKLEWEEQHRFKTSRFSIRKPLFGFTNIVVEGSSANHLEPGSIYDLKISFANYSDVLAESVSVHLESDDPFIILFPPHDFATGDLLPFSGTEITAKVGLHHNAPVGSPFTLNIKLSSGNLPDQTIAYTMSAGTAKVVIVDLDPANSSAIHIRNAINQNQVMAEIAKSFSGNFSDYEVMMVCLGGFPDRHRITIEESEVMESFLSDGGRIYLEGGATWRGDTRRPIHDMFMIQGLAQGWPYGIDSLAGNAGTFAESFAFKYQSPLLRTDNMQAMDSSASVLFSDVPHGLNYTIAYENDLYKTIGSTFKFNGIFQNPGDLVPAMLMKEYLNFFGLSFNQIAANFTADKYYICDGETVEFTLKAAGNIQQVSWEFEGGIPATSSDFSPQVRYDDHGVFAVKLIVSDGVESDTLLLTEIITVESCSGITFPEPVRFNLYPNPASGHIVMMPGNEIAFDADVRVFSIHGTLVSEERIYALSKSNPALINVAALKSGIYFIQIAGDQGYHSSKLIISR